MALALVLPGSPQILEGRRLGGGVVLGGWASAWILLVARWEAVRGVVDTPDGLLAVAIVVGGLLAAPAWSLLEPGRTGRRRRSWWGRFVRSLAWNRLALAGLLAACGLCLAALLAPILAPYDPTLHGELVAGSVRPPSSAHPLGTDQYARDVLSRLLYGARISLGVGLLAVAISVSIGTVVGGVAGYVGGKLDTVLMRLVDMVLSFPRLVLLIAVIAVVERPSVTTIVAVLGLTLWPSTARLVRGEVLGIREREYVEAGRALGYSRRRILFRHVLPNALGPVIVAATLGVGNVVILEAGLSFLGIGVQPPVPSWGNMVADGRARLLDGWWISTFPGLAIVATVLAFNLLGDGLRDALDPRSAIR